MGLAGDRVVSLARGPQHLGNRAAGSTTLTMSSREIAELVGKRHDHVMRDIRAMLDGLGSTAPSFGGSYTDITDMLTKLHGEGGLPKFGDTCRNMLTGLKSEPSDFEEVNALSLEGVYRDPKGTHNLSILFSPRPPRAAGPLPPDPAPMPCANIPAFRLGIRMGGCMPCGLVNAPAACAAVAPLTIGPHRGRSRASIMAARASPTQSATDARGRSEAAALARGSTKRALGPACRESEAFRDRMRALPPVGRSITDHAAIYSCIGGALSFLRSERFQGLRADGAPLFGADEHGNAEKHPSAAS